MAAKRSRQVALGVASAAVAAGAVTATALPGGTATATASSAGTTLTSSVREMSVIDPAQHLAAGQLETAAQKVVFAQEATARDRAHLIDLNREKEATARQAAAKSAARQSAASRQSATGSGQQDVTSGSPQHVAEGMLGQFGWSDSQFSCLDQLWEHESGWSVTAENPTSGAYGIAQALPGSRMASAGPHWQTDAATQIRWGLEYIQGTYGSPCAAWAHETADGWY